MTNSVRSPKQAMRDGSEEQLIKWLEENKSQYPRRHSKSISAEQGPEAQAAKTLYRVRQNDSKGDKLPKWFETRLTEVCGAARRVSPLPFKWAFTC
jgi:hypothetical protein